MDSIRQICLVNSCIADAWPCWCRDAPSGRFSSEMWRAHVLSNIPFYSLLLPLFLDLTRTRVSFRSDESLEDLKKVSPCLSNPLLPYTFLFKQSI